jgi:electron transport complex protein RnfD
MSGAPYLHRARSVPVIMLWVLAALLPGIVVHAGFFGPGILMQLVVSSLAALVAESAVLALRGQRLAPALSDGSALVTAFLLALCLPPLSPWWLTALGSVFAIVVAKHLYGGLGQNPFNPAMAAYAMLIVAFPALMSQWPLAGEGHQVAGFGESWRLVFGGERALDGITGATPLDALRTGMRGLPGAAPPQISTVMAGSGLGVIAGVGWEWVAAAYALGGLLLVALRVISWHVPTTFLVVLALISALFWMVDPASHAPPWFHVVAGGSMLGAFFVATDPVSGASTPRGKCLFAAGIAVLTYLIRVFGAFPDGIAFATLIMNLCVPIIDRTTQPQIFGHKQGPARRGLRQGDR